jgi:hypothetical protein
LGGSFREQGAGRGTPRFRPAWAENYRVPGETDVTYLVFGVAGELLGVVTVPLGLHVYEIGDVYILGR